MESGRSPEWTLAVTRFLNIERAFFSNIEELMEIKRALLTSYPGCRTTVTTAFGAIDQIIDVQRRFILRAEVVAKNPVAESWDFCFEILSSNYDIYSTYSAAFDEALAAGKVLTGLSAQDLQTSSRVRMALSRLSLPLERIPKYSKFLKVRLSTRKQYNLFA
jgi:hypothetical protein